MFALPVADLFAATEDDLWSRMQGHKKIMELGPMGIRCCHRAHLPALSLVRKGVNGLDQPQSDSNAGRAHWAERARGLGMVRMNHGIQFMLDTSIAKVNE
jgi:hypothetical protein